MLNRQKGVKKAAAAATCASSELEKHLLTLPDALCLQSRRNPNPEINTHAQKGNTHSNRCSYSFSILKQLHSAHGFRGISSKCRVWHRQRRLAKGIVAGKKVAVTNAEVEMVSLEDILEQRGMGREISC